MEVYKYQNQTQHTRGVHFITSCEAPSSRILLNLATKSGRRHNHVCEIFGQSVKGLWTCDNKKMPFSIGLLYWPHNSVSIDACCTVIVMKVIIRELQLFCTNPDVR